METIRSVRLPKADSSGREALPHRRLKDIPSPAGPAGVPTSDRTVRNRAVRASR